MIRTAVVFLLLTLAAGTKTAPLRLTKHPKRCLNLGSWFRSSGPFEAELGLIKYALDPRVLTKPTAIAGTQFDNAFTTQRTGKAIKFSVRVSRKFRYTVTTAHAEIVQRFCKTGARVVRISINGQKRVIDVFKSVGCRTVAFAQFNNIKPTKKGLINVRIKGLKGPAAIAGICIGRKAVRSPKPRPSRKPRPSLKPRPSKSATPAPSVSSTPAPSRSSTPAPTPSSSPKPLVPSKCVQSGCMNFEGHVDYAVIGNSMSYDEDRDNCAIKSSSSAWLALPPGAVVKKAILYWSASGYMSKSASAYLNSVYVAASKTYYGGSSGYYFYGAEADVTHIVRGGADYSVSGIWYDNRGRLCTGNAAYAAWSMVIVYEKATLPRARINVCTDNFKFTFPAGTYSSYVGCISGSVKTVKAKTTVVTFESDAYKGEHFFINGKFLGDNIFRGRTAPNLDIVEFDITRVVRSLVTRIVYTVKSYFVYTRFGGAIEGLFMPVRVVYHTLPH